MGLTGWAKLPRVFAGEADKLEGRSLCKQIVCIAREQGLAGATVLRGVESYGATSQLHTAKIPRLFEDLPIILELVSIIPMSFRALRLAQDRLREESQCDRSGGAARAVELRCFASLSMTSSHDFDS